MSEKQNTPKDCGGNPLSDGFYHNTISSDLYDAFYVSLSSDKRKARVDHYRLGSDTVDLTSDNPGLVGIGLVSAWDRIDPHEFLDQPDERKACLWGLE